MKHLIRILLAPVAALAVSTAFAQGAKQPNILVIWGDDIGWQNVSAYGMGTMGYTTPNIDSIGLEGVRFTDHYTPSPLCAPARASYLTGRYNHRTGAVDVPSNRGLDRLDPAEKTFGDYFRHGS
jgi:arylsulfatase